MIREEEMVERVREQPGLCRTLMMLSLWEGRTSRMAVSRVGPPQRHEDSTGGLEELTQMGLLVVRRPLWPPLALLYGEVRLTERGAAVADRLLGRVRTDEELGLMVSFAGEDARRIRMLATLLFSGRQQAAELGLSLGLRRLEAEAMASDLARKGLMFTIGSVWEETGYTRIEECGLTADGIVVARHLLATDQGKLALSAPK